MFRYFIIKFSVMLRFKSSYLVKAMYIVFHWFLKNCLVTVQIRIKWQKHCRLHVAILNEMSSVREKRTKKKLINNLIS